MHAEKDIDYPKMIAILSKLSNHDKQLHLKTVDCVLSISKHVSHVDLYDKLVNNSFNNTLMDQIKEKLNLP